MSALEDAATPALVAPPPPSCVDELISRLRRIGVVARRDLTVRCEVLTGGVGPSDLLANPDGEVVGQAWRRLLDQSGPADETALITTLACFLIPLSRKDRAFEQGLAVAGLNRPRTHSEAAFRLFGYEYGLGRRLILEPRTRASGVALLSEALTTSRLVNVELHRSSALRGFYGKRGVAQLLLARGKDSLAPLGELRQALVDLEASGALGDTSPQHYEYEAEVLLRLHKHTRDDQLL